MWIQCVVCILQSILSVGVAVSPKKARGSTSTISKTSILTQKPSTNEIVYFQFRLYDYTLESVHEFSESNNNAVEWYHFSNLNRHSTDICIEYQCI